MTMATATIARMTLRITFSPGSEADLRAQCERVLGVSRDEIVLVERGPLEVDDVFELGIEIPVQPDRPGPGLTAGSGRGQTHRDRVFVHGERVIARTDLQSAKVPATE